MASEAFFHCGKQEISILFLLLLGDAPTHNAIRQRQSEAARLLIPVMFDSAWDFTEDGVGGVCLCVCGCVCVCVCVCLGGYDGLAGCALGRDVRYDVGSHGDLKARPP